MRCRRLIAGVAGLAFGASFACAADRPVARAAPEGTFVFIPDYDALTRPGGPGPLHIGLLTNTVNGISARFLAPDRSEPIPYLVDMATLPTGITTNQAWTAVSNAFKAWMNVAPVTFTNEGLAVFGQGADTLSNFDGRIRIQLHDLYDRVSAGRLGIGGLRYQMNTNEFPGGGLGGRIGTNEFDQTVSGHVVIDHTSASMQSTTNLEEVLCHEIGHTLSLAHSSEDPGEADPLLRQSIMYYAKHADSRGAALNAYDTNVIAQVYPENLPPYGFDRVMDIVTSLATVDVDRINEIELRGYDRESASLTILLTNATSYNGAFGVESNLLRYSANNSYLADRLDPGEGSYYEMTQARFSDGTNASPPIRVRVISYMFDGEPQESSDGLPDAWMTNYFHHSNPTNTDLSRAQDDPDGDGRNNFWEFLQGTDPTNASSVLRVSVAGFTSVQWMAKSYEVYEVQRSTNILTVPFRRDRAALLLTNTAGCATVAPDARIQFLRIEKVQ